MGLYDIYVLENADEDDMLTINIEFSDDPAHVHVARLTEKDSREKVSKVLRALADQIEHNIAGGRLH